MTLSKQKGVSYKIKKSPTDRIVDVVIYVALGLVAVSMVLPFLYVFAGSFATEKELTEKAFFIIPEVWSLNAYTYSINSANILLGLRNSFILTIMGTSMCLLFSFTFAYPLSKKTFKGRTILLNMVIITMLFGGGLIPSYMTYTAYGLYDSYWALVLPGLIGPFNMVVIKNFFQEIPPELEEASRIDGCSDLGTFIKIVLPLSKPIIATMALFYGVGFWNDYFASMIYLSSAEKFPIQIQLRAIVLLTSEISEEMMDYYDLNGAPPGKAVQMACTVIATLPILVVYPFIQKHFAKGVMIGAVKG